MDRDRTETNKAKGNRREHSPANTRDNGQRKAQDNKGRRTDGGRRDAATQPQRQPTRHGPGPDAAKGGPTQDGTAAGETAAQARQADGSRKRRDNHGATAGRK